MNPQSHRGKRTLAGSPLMRVGDFLIALLVVLHPAARCEDYLEIKTDITSTFESSAGTNFHRSIHRVMATCVVGTNDWFIAGDFSQNAHIEYWLVETNIAERTTINSGMYLERAKDLVSEKLLGQKNYEPLAGGYPPKGKTYIRVQSWLKSFGGSLDSLVWLAFCSANYLAMPDRQIPIPLGFPRRAAASSDKTTHLDGASGLPKELQLYASNGQLICDYKTLSTTNILGRTYPLEFHFLQYGFGDEDGVRDTSTSKFTVRGKVTSIRVAKRERIPDDVLRELHSASRTNKSPLQESSP